MTGTVTVFGLGGGETADSAPAASVVGWIADVAVPGLVFPANPPGKFSGLDGRTGAGPGASATTTMPAGPLVPIVATLENSGEPPRDPGSESNPQVRESWGSAIVKAASHPGSAISVWADLLDGAIHADWEAFDGELRQFLARLGGLADSQEGRSLSGPAWPFWICAATAVLVARRASHGRWRLFGRPVTGKIRGSGDRPIPVGPWPLGSP
jgi:hypothetical protein